LTYRNPQGPPHSQVGLQATRERVKLADLP
jgi:hypothetical protein